MSTPQDPSHEHQNPQAGWGHQQPPPAQASWGQPGYGYPYPTTTAHPSAGTAMGLGIFALVGGLMCGLPLFAAPFAWAMGKKALREIDANPHQWSGRESANAGYIIGIVGTVFLALGLLASVGAVVVFVMLGP